MKRGMVAFGLFVTGMIILALGIQLIWVMQSEQSQYEKSQLPVTSQPIITDYTGNITQKWTNNVPVLFSGDRVDYYFRINNQTVVKIGHTDYNTYLVNSSYTYTPSQYSSGYNPFPDDERMNNQLIKLIKSPIGLFLTATFITPFVYYILSSGCTGLDLIRKNTTNFFIVGIGIYAFCFGIINIISVFLFMILVGLSVVFYHGSKYIFEDESAVNFTDGMIIFVAYITYMFFEGACQIYNKDYTTSIIWFSVILIFSIVYYKLGWLPKFINYIKTEKVIT